MVPVLMEEVTQLKGQTISTNSAKYEWVSEKRNRVEWSKLVGKEGMCLKKSQNQMTFNPIV